MKPKVYIRNFNGVMDGIIKSDEFERVDNPGDSDCIVLWNDVRGEFSELARINKKQLHKPLLVVQHGAGGSRDYEFPNHFQFLADKFCCWGESDYNRLVKQGNGDKAIITGCTLINQIQPLVPHIEKNIIFSPVMAEREDPANIITFYELKKIELEESQKNLIKHRNQLEASWRPSVLSSNNLLEETHIPYLDINTNFRLIVKTTPIHDKKLYLGSVCETSQGELKHIEGCVRLLTHADVVVGMLESTFQMLAMAMDIPVVICNEYQFTNYAGVDYTNFDHIKTKGVTYCDLKDLRATIEGELANPKRLTKERKEATLREFGDVTSDPDSKIIEIIKGMVKNGKA